MTKFKKFIRENKAATAIEYGLIAALIAIAAIAAFQFVGTGVSNAFQKAGQELNDANAEAGDGGTE